MRKDAPIYSQVRRFCPDRQLTGSYPGGWRNIASLTMSAVSSSFRAHCRMHSENSAISLSKKIAVSNQGSLVIHSGQDSRSDPCISSVSNCDHDYYFELLGEEERDAQSITRCSTAHHGDFRAVPRANRTFAPARNPIPCASSTAFEVVRELPNFTRFSERNCTS